MCIRRQKNQKSLSTLREQFSFFEHSFIYILTHYSKQQWSRLFETGGEDSHGECYLGFVCDVDCHCCGYGVPKRNQE